MKESIHLLSTRLHRAVADHVKWRRQCLNLNAAESILSANAEKFLCTDLSRRAPNGLPRLRSSEGGEYIDIIEDIVDSMLKKLYSCRYSEWRPMSASVADGVVIHALTKVGDRVLATPGPLGHPSWNVSGYAGFRGLRMTHFPMDWDSMEVDYDSLKKVVRSHKFSLAVDGSSLILFPPDFSLLREILTDLPLWYDGAHVMGLIAGHAFPNPLHNGASVLSGSTQKTLSGPLGGVILTNSSETINAVRTCASSDIATPDYGRIAALAVTLTEWKRYGREFAEAIVRNAQVLAAGLSEQGIDVLLAEKGFTSTHQIGVIAPKGMNAKTAASRLARSNIITTPFSVPTNKGEKRQVLRIGTTEITRQGFLPTHMCELANAIFLALRDRDKGLKSVKSIMNSKDRKILYT